MSKFLRKYQTIILVIGGSLLMIAFLIPTTLGQRGGHDQSTEVRYTLTGGRQVTMGEVQRTGALVQTAAQFFPGWMAIYGLGTRDVAQWLLTAELAREQGLMGPKGEGNDPAFVQQVVGEDMQFQLRRQFGEQWQLMLQMRPELVDQIKKDMEARAALLSTPKNIGAAGTSVSTEDLLAQARGIRRLRETYAGVMRVSPTRLMSDAERQYATATVNYLVVPIDERTLPSLPAPTQEQIDAHYAAYKDVPAGTGAHGLGYTMPARTKVQWLTLSRADVAAAVVPDPEEVSRRVKAEPTLPGEEASAKLTRVLQLVRNEVATKAIAAAAETIRNEILLVTSKLPQSTATGARILPAGGSGIDLATLGQRGAERASAVVGRPVSAFKVTTKDAWMTDREALALPGIGEATMRVGAGRMSAVGLAFSVTELSPASPPPTPIQVGLPLSMPLQDGEGNEYFMIVTGARPAGPPLNLDEVRDQVVTDLKKVAALQALEKQAAGWTARAREISLDDVRTSLHAQNPEQPEVRKNASVSRAGGVQPAEPGVDDPAFIDAVFDVARTIDPRQPLDPKDPALTFSVTLPTRFALVIAQITEFRPLTIEDYRRLAAQARDGLVVREMQARIEEPFTLAALGKRYGLEVGRHADEKEAPAPKN